MIGNLSRENRLFIDIDSGDGWLWWTTPLWDELLELVRMEALRLGRTYPLGKRANIMRSDNGWHIRFDEARLTKEQEESLLHESKGHFGHIRFSCEIHDTTLRVSAKARKGSTPPRLREVIELGSIQG
jgi:hypothetical protein